MHAWIFNSFKPFEFLVTKKAIELCKASAPNEYMVYAFENNKSLTVLKFKEATKTRVGIKIKEIYDGNMFYYNKEIIDEILSHKKGNAVEIE